MTKWSIGLAVALTISTLGIVPASASSQSLSGKVLEEEAEGEQVVSGAGVTLLDAQGKELVTEATGADGTFTVRLPRAGRYRLRVGGLGYETATSELIDVLPHDTVEVVFRISRKPMALPPLTVLTSRREVDERLASRGFYEHRELYQEKMGWARFFTTEDIERLNPFRVTDVLREVTGFRVVHLGGRKSDIRGIGGRSVPIYINGVLAKKFPGETINDILAAGDIGAIEAYWGVSPAQYGGYAAIVIWTR